MMHFPGGSNRRKNL